MKKEINKFIKGMESLHEMMDRRGIMSLEELSQRVRKLEEKLKETEDIVVQLSSDVNRLGRLNGDFGI